ncbi:MAG: hypothetical protein K2L54_02535, partial [Clostridiales bacterium]|nr:hypothetical protein [Clostridiales bacterium]
YMETYTRNNQLVAIGFWRINNDFYKTLWEMQYCQDYSCSQDQEFEKVYDIPLYALPVDPNTPSLNPIWSINYKELLGADELEHFAKEIDAAGNELYDGLLALLYNS